MKRTIKEISEFFGRCSERTDLLSHATFDSRKVKKGSLFFALPGARVDGHQFLEEVSEKGGLAAVVSQEYRGPTFGLELIPTPDVQEALQVLARALFKEKTPLVIGVTGTVGKTTTKEFIAAILSEKFRVAKTPGSANSQVGLPLTLLNWEGEEEIFVLEMGMSRKGEIAKLIAIAPPKIAVLTKITLAHAASFRTIEEIAEAKCELFQSSAIAHAFLQRSAAPFQSVQAINVPKTWCEKCTLTAPFREEHLLENLGLAIAVARYLGLSEEEIERGVQKLEPLQHRGRKIEKRGVLFVDDSYNASPASSKAAFASLPSGKKRWALFGAMRELGTFAQQSHREVAKSALSVVDELLCVGQECLPMVDFFIQRGKKAQLFASKEEATKHLKKWVSPGDTVLIKGSSFFKLWTVLEEV